MYYLQSFGHILEYVVAKCVVQGRITAERVQQQVDELTDAIANVRHQAHSL